MMNIICKLFGHTTLTKDGQGDNSKQLYCQPDKNFDDVQRVAMHTHCKRCGTYFHVGNVFLPPIANELEFKVRMDEFIKNIEGFK